MKYCPKCARELIHAEASGKMRLKCPFEDCGYVFWDNPTPVVAGIVEYGDAVILVRQKGWPEKWRGLVTGFLERDEDPEQAILRELREELGLDGQIAGFVGYYSFFQMNQLILAFHLKAHGEITLGEELESYKLIPPAKLRPWALGTGPALRDWLERQGIAAQSSA
ncbi:MAG: NUDIX domain-containing protein [Anaerolineales bacterium]|nr:NUDIX domain-containing protein [Anaerolineales bacterium]